MNKNITARLTIPNLKSAAEMNDFVFQQCPFSKLLSLKMKALFGATVKQPLGNWKVLFSRNLSPEFTTYYYDQGLGVFPKFLI